MNVNIKYLKDEDGNYISPVVSADGVFDSTGVSISTTLGNIGTLLDTINGETSYSIINIINFTIDGTGYQAEEGMTWAEWCNSEYPAQGIGDFSYPYIDDNGNVKSNGAPGAYLDVQANDVIIANHAYATTSTGPT